MLRRVSLLLAAVAVTVALSAGVAQAGGAHSASTSTPAPPVIHEPFASSPLPCSGAPGHRTTLQLEGCLERGILKTDATIEGLDRSIVSLLGKASPQRGFIAGVRAWLAYRSADCEAMSGVYEGGTLAGVVYAECVAARNVQRIADLRKFRSIASA